MKRRPIKALIPLDLAAATISFVFLSGRLDRHSYEVDVFIICDTGSVSVGSLGRVASKLGVFLGKRLG